MSEIPVQKAKTSTTTNNESNGGSPLVLDLGKRKKRQVRALRRGEGPLMEDVLQTVEQLKMAGTIKDEVQPLIIVVREKSRRNLFKM